MALLDYAGVELPIERIATLCRRAENEYVGAKTGIMDQFVVTGAVAHRAMLLDCRALTFELLPLPEDVRVVICNSMVKHRLADVAGYGDRRGEVEAGQAVLRQCRPGIELLRDATVADLEACVGQDECGELEAVQAHYYGECAGGGVAEALMRGRCGSVWGDYAGGACEHAGRL